MSKIQYGVFFLLSFIFPIFMGYVQIFSGGMFSLPFAFLLGVMMAVVYAVQQKFSGKLIVRGMFILLIVFFLSGKCFDFSYDGQAYHQEAAYNLASGWNPVWDRADDVDLLTETYPKALWLYAGMWYSVTGNLLVGKAYNIILALAAILFINNILKEVIGSGRKKVRIGITLLLVFNPVVLAQLFSYYNDGTVYLLLILLSATIYLGFFSKDEFLSKNIGSMLLITLLAILCNTKFTGVVYAGAFSFFTMIALWLKKRKDIYRRVAGILSAGLILGILVIGFNPYVTNTIRHGHPFWPLLGANTIDIITQHEHPDFLKQNRVVKLVWSQLAEMRSKALFDRKEAAETYGLPRIKIPGEIKKQELLIAMSEDPRIGGFGPWFNIVFLLGLASLVVAAKKKIFSKIEWLLLVGILTSVLLNPECWWARYAPQFYLFPILTLLFFIYRRNCSYRWCVILLLPVIINILLVAAPVLAKQVVFEYRFSRDMNKIERAANETGCPIPVVFTDFSVDRITCFEQRGIPYDIVDESTISPIEEPMFISGTHKKILVYSLDDFQ